MLDAVIRGWEDRSVIWNNFWVNNIEFNAIGRGGNRGSVHIYNICGGKSFRKGERLDANRGERVERGVRKKRRSVEKFARRADKGRKIAQKGKKQG